MNHRTASRLLPAVLDRSLPAVREARVRAHTERCPACAAALDEHRAAEALLRRLPASLVPLDPTPAADARLLGLARWAGLPRSLWPERLRLSAAGAVAAAAMLVLVASLAPWDSVAREPQTHQSFASALPGPDLDFGGWR